MQHAYVKFNNKYPVDTMIWYIFTIMYYITKIFTNVIELYITIYLFNYSQSMFDFTCFMQ